MAAGRRSASRCRCCRPEAARLRCRAWRWTATTPPSARSRAPRSSRAWRTGYQRVERGANERGPPQKKQRRGRSGMCEKRVGPSASQSASGARERSGRRPPTEDFETAAQPPCLRSYVRLVDTALLGSTPLTVLSDHWSSADRELLLPMRSSPLTGLRTEGILGVPPTSGTTPDTPPQTGTVFAGMDTLPTSGLFLRWATWGSP